MVLLNVQFCPSCGRSVFQTKAALQMEGLQSVCSATRPELEATSILLTQHVELLDPLSSVISTGSTPQPFRLSLPTCYISG